VDCHRALQHTQIVGAAHATSDRVTHHPDPLAHRNRRRIFMIRQKHPRPLNPDCRLGSRSSDRLQLRQLIAPIEVPPPDEVPP